MTTVLSAVLVFILVEAALLIAIFLFRERPGTGAPRPGHGSTEVEVVWTIIPALILAIIAAPTVRAMFGTAEVPADAIEIEVVGH
jgi:cytochrome c oxidase subunit 2